MPGRVAIVSLGRIENAILIIRGQKVLLDRDLAAHDGQDAGRPLRKPRSPIRY